MDWGQAKTILIVSFFILNIFLIGQLWESIQNSAPHIPTEKISDQQLTNSLSSAQVKITKIPNTEPREMYPAVVTTSTLPTGWKADNLGLDSKTFNSFPKNSTQLATWVESTVPFIKDFNLYHRSNNKITYYQLKNGSPIFDAKLIIELNKTNRVIRLKHYQVTAEAQKVNVIPFNNILLRLINSGMIPKNSNITDTGLGYRACNPTKLDEYYLIPYWRVTINNKRHYYVNAINCVASEDIDVEEEHDNT